MSCEQTMNFMSNPFDPNSEYNNIKGKIQQPVQDKDNSNATTITMHRTLHLESNDKLTNNIKKIKPPLEAKPTEFPPCFNTLSTHYTDAQEQNTKTEPQKQLDQQDSIAFKTRMKKPTKQKIICEGEERSALSVIREQPTNQKPWLVSKRLQKNQTKTEPAELTATISPKSNLREKYAHLLPSSHQRTLSSEQIHLIKIMKSIDQALEFWSKNHNRKFLFFQEVKRNMRDSMRILIDFKHLEQLLYLDDSLYQIKWEKSKDLKKYDILMKLPPITSMQERKQNFRQTIIAFLSVKHQEFLKTKGINNFVDNGSWHEEFQPYKYEIPRLPLPPHPQTKQAQMRCWEESKINGLKNEKVREFVKKEKERSDVKSFRKEQSAMELIFAGTSAEVLEQRLIAAVKQKEEKTRLKLQMQARQIEREKTEVKADKLKEVAQILMKTYTARNVSNIYKVKVIEFLKEKTNNKYGDLALNRHLEYLIEQTGIGFLKEVDSRGNKILQISISKYKDVLAHVKELKNKEKQEEGRL